MTFKTISIRKSLLLLAILAFAPAVLSAQTVRYVKTDGSGDGSSWANASSDLQAMIDASQVGDEVWVAQGIYKPTQLIHKKKKTSRSFLLKEGVALYGSFEGTESKKDERRRKDKQKAWDFSYPTILDGDDDTPDVWKREIDPATTYRYQWTVMGNQKNASHLLYGGKTPFNERTIVDGFVVRNGNANVWKVYAGGAGLMAAGNIQVKNCIFRHNYATTSIETTRNDIIYNGGAVCILSGSQKALVEDCSFEDNMCLLPTLSAKGGGIYIDNGTVRNCSFKNCVAGDLGGAIYALGGKVESCTVDNSYAGGGGGIFSDQAKITKCTVLNCRAIKGGGILNSKGVVARTLVANSYACAKEYLQSLGGGVGASIFNEEGKVISSVAYCGTADRCGGIASNGGEILFCTAQNCLSTKTDIEANIYTFNGLKDAAQATVKNSIFATNVPASNFEKAATESGWQEPSEERNQKLLALSYALTKDSEFIDKAEEVTATTVEYDFLGNDRVIGDKADFGAYEYIQKSEPLTDEDIQITFATTEPVTIGLGGAADTSFDIDWGDGKRITYEGAKNISETPKGNTIKIYGKKIQILKAATSGITSLKIQDAPLLSQIFIGGNKISELDLTHCPALTGLYCSENRIKSLDLSKNTKMRAFECARNQIEGTLDCSTMMELTSAKLFNNKVSKLLLPAQDKLIEVDCDSNRLELIDVSLLPNLEDLSCANNLLTQLDLAKNKRLYELHAGYNQIKGIDLSPLAELKTCSMANNLIQSIDVSKNLKLENLYLQGNLLESIDLKKNKALMWLNLEHNKLTAVDFSMLPNLMQILVSDNQLTELDISKNTKANTVKVGMNKLTKLDVSNQPNMFWLICEKNQLTELDLSKNKSVSWLECGSNMLTELDVRHLSSLQKLFCDKNKLTQLDLSQNKKLQGLNIAENQFSKEVLDGIMMQLPDVSSVEIHDNNREWAKILNISFNPGTKEAQKGIAEKKAWKVITNGIRGLEEVTTALAEIRYSPSEQALVATCELSKLEVYNLRGASLLSFARGNRFDISSLGRGVFIAVGINEQNERIVIKFIR